MLLFVLLTELGCAAPHASCDAARLTQTGRSESGDFVVGARLVDSSGKPIQYARIDFAFDGVSTNEDFEPTSRNGIAVLRAGRTGLAYDRRAYAKTFTGAYSVTFDGAFMAEGRATPPANTNYCRQVVRGRVPAAALPSPM